MRDEGTCQSQYTSEATAPDYCYVSDSTDLLLSVTDRALARLFAIELQLERALSLTLNPMARPRIARALSEADQAAQEMRQAVSRGGWPAPPDGAKIITVHPEAWAAVDAGVRGVYRARAEQLGLILETGDTGIPNRNVILVLADKAEWLPSDGQIGDDAGWERTLQELLELD